MRRSSKRANCNKYTNTMARFWTRKQEDYSKDEETMQPEDFLVRLVNRKKEQAVEKPKIENTK